ncbi:M16 family metallopeptidase [Mesoterricola silvestris]|uniref:Peptidase M16 n=1 Tax=Mesoterricola silvestris TaxID=2927979 RepID=A0AA48KDT4_9BACT|nr:pitrilysin family protein [Mesoterricola silvestris]BDU74768.1 peptidase M16 [Mesoterricola silvestris]
MMNLGVPTLLMLACTLAAQPIPARPELLPVQPLVFKAPRARDFKVTLRNGIPAFIVPDPEGQPIVRVKVLYRGGSYLDPAGKEGLAALFGNQIRRGGTEVTPVDELDERLAFLAAGVHGRCGATSGSLSLEVLEKDLETGLAAFMEVLTRPAFAQASLDLARQDQLQALAKRNDSANSISGYQFGYLLRGESHFASAQATQASLARITREDLRAFHARILHPANLVVTASGPIDPRAFKAVLDRTVGALKPGREARVSPPVPAPTFTRTPGLYLCGKAGPQSVVALAVPGLRRGDPDWPAAMLMEEILGGGGVSSRLMKRLRNDEGLTYGVSTRLEPGTFWKGDLLCRFQTKNRSVAYALRLVLEEVEKLKREPVGEQEFSVARDGLIQAFPSRFSDAESVAGLFAGQNLNGQPEDYFLDFRERLRSVTRDQVREAARKYLDMTRMVLLVVGDVEAVRQGDAKDHPGRLGEGLGLPVTVLPLRDPSTLRPLP